MPFVTTFVRTRRTKLLCGAAALTAAALAASAVQAQDPTEVEEIVITGSRIAVRAENAAQPVQLVTPEQITRQGVVAIADVLDVLPALQAGESAAQANGGAATLNLRGMGDNRTLVLVNGRRHVAGVQGSAAVDISTIPSGLVERVDVLTGGASAVYGSDAVTGVVNFVLKDDFEGTEFDIQAGLSGEGDRGEVFASFLHGRNFAGGRGNLTVALQGSHAEELFYGDRDWSRDNRVANDYPNPARVFQVGDPVPPGRTANTVIGRSILLADGSPRYAGTDPALIARAQAAAPRTYYSDPRFAISSIGGLIGYDPYGFGFAGGPGDFATTPDLDNNGTFDCLQSIGGRGSAGGFPVGCWVTDPVTGEVRPFRDGLVGAFTNHSGGDGAPETFNNQTLLPRETSLNLNINLNYEVSPAFRPYVEFKYAYNEGVRFNPYNTFDDSIPIALDNPFIPTAIRNIVNAEIAAGNGDASSLVTLARDNTDLFDPRITSERHTTRIVVGFDGEFDNGWSYDVALNHGRTDSEARSFVRLEDRYFAAIDAVTDPATGQAVCRSTLDPTAFPRYSYLTDTANFGPGATIQQFGGFTTFTPGAGSPCRPVNLFGVGAASAEALEFLRYEAVSQSEIEQTVLSAYLVGDSAAWFSLPGGPVGFVIGAEYRDESSDFTPDPYDAAGYTFQYQSTAAVSGGYDVKEAFAELDLPILANLPFAELLTLKLAGRVGDYSTVGETSTWNASLIWSPVRDLRVRGGYSVAIRAPNIAELYSPVSSATFRPVDPCDIANIGLGNNPANREANCRADLGIAPGAPYTFTDPLTARFTGQAGGNPNLGEESATTYTYGLVLTPRFLEGFSATIDYWNIEIEDAIAAVSAQDIVNSCYDAPDLNNQYCALFTRNRTVGSPTYLGFNYLLQTQLNFARLEASGVDFNFAYGFDLEKLGQPTWGSIRAALGGQWWEDRNNFPFVANPNQANPVKEELSYPEWAVNASLTWSISDFTVSWFTNYQGRQTLGSTPIEDVANFSPQFTDDFFSHNASVEWQVRDDLVATIGVRNLTDEEPYLGTVATPVSSVGRTFFVRLLATY
jgi:iron complex outermembrane receptor protein